MCLLLLPSFIQRFAVGFLVLSIGNAAVYAKSLHHHPRYPTPVAVRIPSIRSLPKKPLTLGEAILLALRMNPSVRSSELQRVTDKYQVEIAHNEFEPQYQLTFSNTMTNRGTPTYTGNAGMTVKTPIGTQIGVAYTTPFQGASGQGTLTISQPLLRGFGFVNRIPWLDALSNDSIARLMFKNAVMLVVQQVIVTYRNLVQDYNQLAIQKATVKQAEEQVHQAELRYKAGKVAHSELIQHNANLETTRLSAIQQKNQLQRDYQNFLSALGLVPTANLQVEKKIDVHLYKVPGLKNCIRLALQNNIAYQKALKQLNVTRRAILTAKDARRIKLDANFTGAIGDVSGITTFSGDSTTTTLFQPGPTVGFDLVVPIDDVKAKANWVQSKIAYEQAKLALKKQKDDLVRRVMTLWKQLEIQQKQIAIARRAVDYKRQSYEDATLKFRYGRSSAFQVTELQSQLLRQQTNLVGIKIEYLNNITQLNQVLGVTLNIWGIKLVY